MLGHADGTSFPCLDGAGADQYPNQSLPAQDGDSRVATAGQRVQHVSAPDHLLSACDHGTRKENTGKGLFRLSLCHTDHRGRAIACLTVCAGVTLKQAIPKVGSGKILSWGVGWGARMFWSHWMGLLSPFSINPLWQRSEQLQEDGT